MKVYLDDERTPREPIFTCEEDSRPDWREWIVVRRVVDTIELLETGKVRHLSLDHDLGAESIYGTGYDVLLWIERKIREDRGWYPPALYIHTANPSARSRMEKAVHAIEAYISSRPRT